MAVIEPDIHLGLRLVGPAVGDFAGLFRRGVDRSRELLHELRGEDVLAQAVAARARGNLAAAYWLGLEAAKAAPEDRATASFAWQVARDYGRPEEGLAAASLLIEGDVSGDPAAAAEVWLQVSDIDLELSVYPAILARLLEPLSEAIASAADDSARTRGSSALLRALQQIAASDALEPPVALCALRYTQDCHRALARRLAERALQSPHLHEVKRARLQAMLDSTEGGESATDGGSPILTDLESVAEDATVDSICEFEPGGEAAGPSVPNPHPARNHPLYCDRGSHIALSEDEVRELRQRIQRAAGS